METAMITAAMIVFTSFFGASLVLLLQIFDSSILKPTRLRSKLEKQGFKGPAPSILYGNIPEMKGLIQLPKPPAQDSAGPPEIRHHWFPSVFPHLEHWRNEYGPAFLYSTGTIQILCISDPEMVKELSLCTSLSIGKPSYLSTERGPLLGRGILSSNGPYWAHQRKIIAPEFYLDKVKGMLKLMAESTLTMLKAWEKNTESLEGKVEISVDDDLRRLSADIISRACFGRSYLQGEKIFSKLQSLQRVMSRGNIGVPGLRYLPTKHNREIWKLESEIDSMILEVVKSRSHDDDDDDNKKDLLQLLLDAAESCGDDSNIPADITPSKFVVDNCKNIYFAGHETTAISLAWCLMTLAAHPDWQARAREEVLEICGTNTPTADMLRNMKVLTMVIQETLRLYPPVAYVVREALQDIQLKGINVPKGINIQVPIPIMHQFQQLWGSESHKFKPDRFINGISGACKIPQAYMPFGMGTRTCTGQHFAMAELKVVLSLTLSRFRLSLSPAYHHSPVFRLLIQPENGVCILLEKL
ncbi:cytochrome p450 714c2 [Phtheirospermum japonicum]|uniref:Cytochrome p450 714c2 n=1 Tax=Phtheirospermum japonicum TaxID=374723 RepID=A0A830C578_9LAMI|nr:cytochrome p450 714c2 [Phtheirospermum japonicum]